jgi:hypothetical protein
MGIYLDPGNKFHRDEVAQSLECPHCGAGSSMRAGGVPNFGQLQARRPHEIGIVFQCDVCNKPVFMRYRVRDYRSDRIELAAGEPLSERSVETFPLQYLPDDVAKNFADTLGCYSHEFHNAFAVMCRRTAMAMFDSLGDRGKLQCYDHAAEIQRLAQIAPRDFELVRHILFEMDLDKAAATPVLTRMQAAVLLEVIKDMLHQAYVRGAKLRRALELRRYFADQTEAARGIERPDKDDCVDPESDKGADRASMIVRVMNRAGQN